MRYLFLIGLILVSSGCNSNGGSSHQKTYVISKSTETAEDSEAVTGPAEE